MHEWWESLAPAARFFWMIAGASTLFQILLFAGSFIGGHDLDHSADAGHDGASDGLKLLSLRAIVAFLIGFGWVGGLTIQNERPVWVACIAAFVAGLVFMGAIVAVMRLMMRLRDDGTMDFANAVGVTGHVYVTIPPANTGKGQIEILIQGRLATLQAITESSEPLPPNTPIIVTRIEAGNLLVVSPA